MASFLEYKDGYERNWANLQIRPAGLGPYAMPIFLALSARGALGKMEKWSQGTAPLLSFKNSERSFASLRRRRPRCVSGKGGASD